MSKTPMAQISLMLLSLLALTTGALAQGYAKPPEEYIYEKPTLEKLSQLYWALSKFDLADNRFVDNFMRINECEIFTNYSNNEFEWKDIRESARKYIVANVSDFPTRFEVEQQLYLSEYDFEQQVFEIWDPYKIDGMKLFEVLSPEFNKTVCGAGWRASLFGYPRGIILEIPRPVSILNIKMTPESAETYVRMKGGFNSNVSQAKNKRAVYQTRDAYLILKVKFFSLKGDEIGDDGRVRTRALAALEGIEIYADRARKVLLHSEVFRQREGSSTAEDVMKKRFEARRKKREEDAAKEQ